MKKFFTSNCQEFIIKGDRWQIVKRYETLAETAENEGEIAKAHTFWNHAEHYRKDKDGL